MANSVNHIFYSSWKEGREFKTETFDKNNQLRGRTATEWEKPATVAWGDNLIGIKARVKSVASTMFEGGQSLTGKTEYGYDNASITNNKTDEWMRDYGIDGSNPGRILKHTQTSYLKINPANSLDYTSDAIYLHGLPESSKLFDVKANGAEELISHSEMKYDEPGYPLLTYTGSPTGWTNPNTTVRGKATTARVWNSDTNSWLETHAQFDQFGNGRKAWDTSGDDTRFVETEYSPDYQYGLPTKIITPAPDPTNTNGTDQTSFATTVYNFYTGQTLSITDEFGQMATTEYNDVLLRPTKVIPAAGGAQTVFEYGDTAGNLFVKVKKQLDATNWDEATTYLDGLGRAKKTQAKDSQGDVFVETEYDTLGRVKQVTNPFRAGETKLWSKPRYDDAGRAVESFAPALDGQTGASLGITSFSISTVSGLVGTVITSTDASGRKSRSITNALGQLVRVDEPTATGGTETADLGTLASPNQPTYYNYSPQGKMVKVQQGKTGETIQNRYFKYDSLGRLIRVHQPEQEVNAGLTLADGYNPTGQWTAAFSYDIFGNVLTATDAKGIVTYNTYDQASRLKVRTYSDTTPPVSYFYDGEGLLQKQSPNYAKGKLTKVKSDISETRYTLFDNLGRLTQSEQRTPFSDAETIYNAAPRISKYKYNLSGALVEQEYPSTRVVKNEFETDGDLSRISGKANTNATERTYANGFSYTADGRIERLKLGNGLWESAKFNTRLQVTELALGHSAGDGGLWKLAYDYGELNTDGSVNSAKNTGNIAKQSLSFNGLAQPFVQTFKYDSVYRLTEARETNNSNQTWKQVFSYDRFGNRLTHQKFIGTTEIVLDNKTHPTINASTNRLNSGQGYIFDKNGNLTTDAEGRQFIFNGENKQSEVRDINNVLVGRYFYDGEGKRVKKITYDPNGVERETTVFVYDGMGKLVAEYSTAPPPQNPTTSYTATDQLGSPRVITNSLGEVISRRDFMPFGEEINPDGTYRKTTDKYGTVDSVRQRFTGYQKDEETGLDFAEARMYENRHGRFTAVDPLLASGKSANPQTFNRYAYVMNNPLAYTDPSGQCPTGNCPANWSGAVFTRTANGKTWYNNERPAILGRRYRLGLTKP